MITKKTFIEIINLIKEQEKIDREVSKAIELISDTWVFINTKNLQYKALSLLLKECFNDKEDWIGWWLYEDVDKIITYKDGTILNINDVGDLYDFLVKEI